MLIRRGGPGSVRLRLRIGGRLIDQVALLPYADLGVGAELFLSRTAGIAFDLSTAVPVVVGAGTPVLTRLRSLPEEAPSDSRWPLPGTSPGELRRFVWSWRA